LSKDLVSGFEGVPPLLVGSRAAASAVQFEPCRVGAELVHGRFWHHGPLATATLLSCFPASLRRPGSSRLGFLNAEEVAGPNCPARCAVGAAAPGIG
jgi:hypothetical protein